jgi:RNA polymerase sigma-70 factor (ECF subfamily)
MARPRVTLGDPESRVIRWRPAARETTEFEQVALVHLDALYQTALRLTRNRAEAEDVVQETFLRAFRAFDRFDPGTNCRAWLFTILRNVFYNRTRQAGREVADEDGTRLAEAVESATTAYAPDDPEEELFQSILHGDVERALNTLPLVYRDAVILADLEGLTYKEVAQVLGCPIGTVMSRLYRGRDLLRRALADFAREHGYLRDQS